jgi:hypothetical protein
VRLKVIEEKEQIASGKITFTVFIDACNFPREVIFIRSVCDIKDQINSKNFISKPSDFTIDFAKVAEIWVTEAVIKHLSIYTSYDDCTDLLNNFKIELAPWALKFSFSNYKQALYVPWGMLTIFFFPAKAHMGEGIYPHVLISLIDCAFNARSHDGYYTKGQYTNSNKASGDDEKINGIQNSVDLQSIMVLESNLYQMKEMNLTFYDDSYSRFETLPNSQYSIAQISYAFVQYFKIKDHGLNLPPGFDFRNASDKLRNPRTPSTQNSQSQEKHSPTNQEIRTKILDQLTPIIEEKLNNKNISPEVYLRYKAFVLDFSKLRRILDHDAENSEIISLDSEKIESLRKQSQKLAYSLDSFPDQIQMTDASCAVSELADIIIGSTQSSVDQYIY